METNMYLGIFDQLVVFTNAKKIVISSFNMYRSGGGGGGYYSGGGGTDSGKKTSL